MTATKLYLSKVRSKRKKKTPLLEGSIKLKPGYHEPGGDGYLELGKSLAYPKKVFIGENSFSK